MNEILIWSNNGTALTDEEICTPRKMCPTHFINTVYKCSALGSNMCLCGKRSTSNRVNLARLQFARIIYVFRRSQWPRGLRLESAAACLLGLRVRIPPGVWICVSCECLCVVR
jgi:hypothetical protein